MHDDVTLSETVAWLLFHPFGRGCSIFLLLSHVDHNSCRSNNGSRCSYSGARELRVVLLPDTIELAGSLNEGTAENALSIRFIFGRYYSSSLSAGKSFEIFSVFHRVPVGEF